MNRIDAGVTAGQTTSAIRAAVLASVDDGIPVLVEGPLGSGVSWTLEDISTQLRRAKLVVRHGRVDDLDRLSALAGLRTSLTSSPSVVVVDDVHLVHPEDVSFLVDLLRDARPGVALLLGGRAGLVPSALRSCVGERHHLLPAWQLGDVLAAYPAMGRTRAEEVLQAADGRPAYVHALAGIPLLRLRELHRLPVDVLAEHVDLGAFRGWAAGTFADVGTRLVAATAAVLGDTVDLDAVAEVAGLENASVARAASLPLLDQGVLTVRTGRVGFAHPVLRAVCYAQVDPAGRQVLHRRAIERARDPRRPGAVPIASHLGVAAVPGDLAAATELVAAARDCLPTSPSTAERWSRCALRLCPSVDEPVAVAARTVLASALADEGRVVEAAALAKELVCVPAARQEAIVVAAQCERAIGNESVAAALLRTEVQGLRSVDLVPPLLIEAATAGVLAPEQMPVLSPGHRVAVEIVDFVRREGGMDKDREALVNQAGLIRTQLAALSSTDLARVVDQLAPFAFAALRLGLTTLAADLVAHGLHVVGSRGGVYVDLLAASAVLDLRRGRLESSLRSAQCAQDVAGELGLARAGKLATTLVTYLYAVTHGTPVTEPTADDLSTLAHGDPEAYALRCEARAMLAAAEGDPWWVAAIGFEQLGGPRCDGLTAEAAAIGGDVESALSLLGRRPESGSEVDIAWWTRSAAAVFCAAGDAAAGLDLATEAVSAWSRIGWPLELGRARLLLAEALRRTGDFRRAERESGLAKAVFLKLGADSVAARAVVLQKRIAASQSRGLCGGEFGLSAREAEIARLVCSGQTNREIAGQLFLSVRTVDSHVAKVLAKVGVQTRVALAAIFSAAPPAVA